MGKAKETVENVGKEIEREVKDIGSAGRDIKEFAEENKSDIGKVILNPLAGLQQIAAREGTEAVLEEVLPEAPELPDLPDLPEDTTAEDAAEIIDQTIAQEESSIEQAAELEQFRSLLASRGRQRTILTGARGLTEKPTVERKTLLGR